MSSSPLRLGLNCDVFPASDDPAVRRRCGVWLDYVDLVGALGAAPVLLPPSASSLRWLEELDGVLLIGGDDYRAGNPAGEPENFTAVDSRREEFDLAIARAVADRGLPTLAICGGFQLQVLVEGGTIFGDLDSERPTEIVHRRASTEEPVPMHDVEWLVESPGIDLAPGTYRTNSFHHQAIDRLPEGWTLLATSPDGIVEAARAPGPFRCGVQWHPEQCREEVSRAVVGGFFAAARGYRDQRDSAGGGSA